MSPTAASVAQHNKRDFIKCIFSLSQCAEKNDESKDDGGRNHNENPNGSKGDGNDDNGNGKDQGDDRPGDHRGQGDGQGGQGDGQGDNSGSQTSTGVTSLQASRTPPSQAKPSSPSPLVTPNPPSSPGSDPAQTMTTPQPSSSQGATSATVPSGTMSTQILSSPLPFPFSSSSNSGIAIAIPTNGSSGSVPILTSFGAPSPASTNFTPPTSNAPSAASGASHKVNAGAIAGGILGALVLLVIIAFAVVLLKRRRRRHMAPSAEFLNRSFEQAVPSFLVNSPTYYPFGSANAISSNDDSSVSHTTTLGHGFTFPARNV